MIREATHDDIDVMIPMFLNFFDGVEMEQTGLYPDADTVEFFMRDMIDMDNASILLADIDGEIIGGILGSVVPWMFNANIITLVELGWFIPKENRNKYPVAAMSLRKKFRKWGKSLGATTLVMSSTKREESPRVIEMYERSGLKHIDSNFIGRF